MCLIFFEPLYLKEAENSCTIKLKYSMPEAKEKLIIA